MCLLYYTKTLDGSQLFLICKNSRCILSNLNMFVSSLSFIICEKDRWEKQKRGCTNGGTLFSWSKTTSLTTSTSLKSRFTFKLVYPQSHKRNMEILGLDAGKLWNFKANFPSSVPTLLSIAPLFFFLFLHPPPPSPPPFLLSLPSIPPAPSLPIAPPLSSVLGNNNH